MSAVEASMTDSGYSADQSLNVTVGAAGTY